MGFSGPGLLSVKLRRASHLPELPEHELEISEKAKSDQGSANDPYVRFKAGLNTHGEKGAGRRVQSSVSYSGGTEPNWNEDLQLITPGNDEDLMIKIMDWEKYGARRLLAQGYIDLSLLKPREKKSIQVKLKPTGVLDVDITYEPYSAMRLADV